MVDLEEMWSVPKREKGIDEVGEITVFSLSFCWVFVGFLFGKSFFLFPSSSYSFC